MKLLKSGICQSEIGELYSINFWLYLKIELKCEKGGYTLIEIVSKIEQIIKINYFNLSLSLKVASPKVLMIRMSYLVNATEPINVVITF